MDMLWTDLMLYLLANVARCLTLASCVANLFHCEPVRLRPWTGSPGASCWGLLDSTCLPGPWLETEKLYKNVNFTIKRQLDDASNKRKFGFVKCSQRTGCGFVPTDTSSHGGKQCNPILHLSNLKNVWRHGILITFPSHIFIIFYFRQQYTWW